MAAGIPDCILCQEAESSEFLQSRNPTHEMVLSTFRVDLLSSINLILGTRHRLAQRFVSKVILDLPGSQSIVYVNHHIYYLPDACLVLI